MQDLTNLFICISFGLLRKMRQIMVFVIVRVTWNVYLDWFTNLVLTVQTMAISHLHKRLGNLKLLLLVFILVSTDTSEIYSHLLLILLKGDSWFMESVKNNYSTIRLQGLGVPARHHRNSFFHEPMSIFNINSKRNYSTNAKCWVWYFLYVTRVSHSPCTHATTLTWW